MSEPEINGLNERPEVHSASVEPFPSVGVVIPLYNHERYIRMAIESVLSQTSPVNEIVVIDDGSTDDGLKIARDALGGDTRARVIHQSNAGAHAAINRGVELCASDYVAVLNSDDIFTRDKIQRCRDILRGQPDIGLVFGAVEIIDQDGESKREGETIDWLARARAFLEQTGNLALSVLHENFAVTTSNMVFSRRVWSANGGFQPLRYCHDLDFLLGAVANGRVHYDAQNSHVLYRVHPRNTIKESSDRARFEVAAVAAVHMRQPRTGLLRAKTAGRDAAHFMRFLENRALGVLVATLSACYADFTDAGAFYEYLARNESWRWATASHVAQDPAHGCAGMGIVIELPSFDKGGLEKVALDTALLFRERGLRPLIVSVGKVGHLGAIARSHGLEVARLPSRGRSLYYSYLLRSRRIVLAISHFSRTGYPLFKKLGIPNITFIHNVYAMLNDEQRRIFTADDPYVDRYISVSRNATRYATQKIGISEAKVATIPNGVNIAELATRAGGPPARREDFGFAPGDYVFLNVASYNLHKAHYLMLRAMQLIKAQRSDIKILCIGNDVVPAHGVELRGRIASAGLTSDMVLHGYCRDVAPVYQMADAFLLPSFIEGWSIAMNEAMYFGKPMILSDTGGAREVISGEDIGILLPNEYGDTLDLNPTLLDDLAYTPRDYKTASALAAAMMRFADERSRWQAAGQLGREKILMNYDLNLIIDHYIREIGALVARPS